MKINWDINLDSNSQAGQTRVVGGEFWLIMKSWEVLNFYGFNIQTHDKIVVHLKTPKQTQWQ